METKEDSKPAVVKQPKKVFILEDDPMRLQLIRARLFDAYTVVDHTDTCAGMGKFKPPYDLILLDHDLGGRQMEDHEDSGTTFARLIKPLINPEAVVLIHSYNPNGAERMFQILTDCQAMVLLKSPFGGDEFNAMVDTVVDERWNPDGLRQVPKHVS